MDLGSWIDPYSSVQARARLPMILWRQITDGVGSWIHCGLGTSSVCGCVVTVVGSGRARAGMCIGWALSSLIFCRVIFFFCFSEKNVWTYIYVLHVHMYMVSLSPSLSLRKAYRDNPNFTEDWSGSERIGLEIFLFFSYVVGNRNK